MSIQNRRNFIKKAGLGLVTIPAVAHVDRLFAPSESGEGPETGHIHFTTGFKISEVTHHSAIFWTRLCSQAVPNPIVHERREMIFRHPIAFDENQPVEDMDGGVRGIVGVARVKVHNEVQTIISPWVTASADGNYTVRFFIDGLANGTAYHVEFEAKADGSERSWSVTGTFRTAPEPRAQTTVSFVASTCQYFWSFDNKERGFNAYDSMRRLHPDFYVHTGDYVYYDKPGPLATTLEKARHKWCAMDSRPAIRELLRNVPIYLLKDDHDLLKNDVDATSGPYGQLTYADGLKVWREHVPLGGKPYRTFQWGEDLQLWLMEAREYRSNNDFPDGPDKSIWGREQIQWFKDSVADSTATFKLLISPTPIVGPDRHTKKDNHANNTFHTEGTWLRKYLSSMEGLFVISGDRHWQYFSSDIATGLLEFGSGPVSDFHAQGWNPDDLRPEHRFVRVKGGFLHVRVHRENGRPCITFNHCDVHGNVVNTYSQISNLQTFR